MDGPNKTDIKDVIVVVKYHHSVVNKVENNLKDAAETGCQCNP